MFKMAGKMGWKDRDFWFSTPSYFFAAYEGWMEQERDRANVGFAQARLIAYYAIAPHLEKGSRTTQQDIWPLPWDQEHSGQVEEVSEDELIRFEAATERARAQIILENGQWRSST